jgi:hypothetical protein
MSNSVVTKACFITHGAATGEHLKVDEACTGDSRVSDSCASR